MAILTEQGAGTYLGPLEELRVTDRDGATRTWVPGRMTRRLLAGRAEIAGAEIPDLLIRLLVGPGRPGESLVALFGGSRRLELRRDQANRPGLRIGQHELDLGGRNPAEILFGVDAATLVRELVVDGRDVRPEAGAEALRDALRQLLGLPPVAAAVPTRPAEDLEALRKRRRLLERELDALPREETIAAEPVDPPAMGDLLEALEAAREVDRRILTRRLELAQAYEKAIKQPVADFLPANQAVLEQLETLADELERERGALGALKRRETAPTPFWVKGLTVVLVIIALLSALAGKSLPDPGLVTFGLATAGAVVLLLAGLWFGRLRGVITATRQARRMRAGRQELRERARALLARVGAMTDPDNLGPETIRDLIDRLARRDFGRIVKDLVAPFVDTPAELGVVRKLARALETPLERAAEALDARTPAVPLVRVTRAALGLAKGWSEALEESGRRVEAVVTRKVRARIEREMLEESIEKLRTTERTLELAAGAGAGLPRGNGDGAARKAAQRLEIRLLPLLRRGLGDRAPRGFGADLLPAFDRPPTAEVNAFIMLLATLVDIREPAFLREPLGRFLIDGNLFLDDELEVVLARCIAELPQCGTLNLAFRRAGLERAFREAAAPLIPALIADGATGRPAPAELYSGHVARDQVAAAPAHVLL